MAEEAKKADGVAAKPNPGTPAIKEGSGKGSQAAKDAAKEQQKAGVEAAKAQEKAAPVGADPKVTAENLKAQGVTPNKNSASGIAASADEDPEEDTAVEGTVVHEGNSPAQTEPAIMTPGGSIPHGFVSTPSGPMPASAQGGASRLTEYGKKLASEGKRGKLHAPAKLSEEQVQKMTKPELRAVARDRGYEIGDGGHNTLARAFLRAQDQADTTDTAKDEG